MGQLKVGDIVIATANCGSIQKDREYTIQNDNGTLIIKADNGSVCSCVSLWKLKAIIPEKTMAKLNPIASRAVDEDTKVLIESGVLDTAFNLTTAGTKFLMQRYLIKQKKAIATELKKKLETAKEEEKVEVTGIVDF